MGLCCRRGRAQYTNDFQTNTIDGVISNWSGNYVVGTSSFHDDVLIVTNAGVLKNTFAGYVGYTTTASSNNTALVTGAGSVWSNGTALYVGSAGGGNQLMIASGGAVYSKNGYIGSNAGANNNTALVTGAGSVWSNSGDFFMGLTGAGSQLTITNGGAVYAPTVTVGNAAGSSNNTLTISGGTLAANTLNSVGGGLNNAVSVDGGTLRPFNANGAWSKAMTLSNAVTFNSLDLGGTARTTTVSGTLSGPGALTKVGLGTLTLSGANTYSGGTIVNAGALALTGAGTLGGGHIGVESGATLDLAARSATLALSGGQVLTNCGTVTSGLIIGSGTSVTGGGSFSGAVTNQAGGTLTPGVGGDTNYFANLTLNGGSTNLFWLGSAAPRDMSTVTNSLTDGGTPTDAPLLQLDLSSWSGSYGEKVVLYDNLTGVTAWDGTNALFKLADLGGAMDGMLLTNGMVFAVSGSGTGQFKINYDLEGAGGAGNDILLTVIPEPASLHLLAMLGAAFFMRRASIARKAAGTFNNRASCRTPRAVRLRRPSRGVL